MPSVTVSAPSLVRSTSADAETPFTAAQARRFPVPAFKVAYASPGNYNDDTVVLSQLQTLKVFVAYTPLTGAPGAGADYSSWFVTKVEGEYQSSYTGSLAVLSATYPEQVEIPLLLAVEVHDAAEPDRLVLPDFEGPVQMLYGCVGPGSRGRAAPCVSPRDPPTASALTRGCRSSACARTGSSSAAWASCRPSSTSRGSSARCTRTRCTTTASRRSSTDPPGPSGAGETGRAAPSRITAGRRRRQAGAEQGGREGESINQKGRQRRSGC